MRDYTVTSKKEYAQQCQTQFAQVHPELFLSYKRAKDRVYRAVLSGRLIRPDTCQQCGKECKPEGSHQDYDQPLNVEWLCISCHRTNDKKNPRLFPRG